MAKQQSFADKAKKKTGTDLLSVKVITSERSDKGSFKYNEKFVKVKDLADVEKAIA